MPWAELWRLRQGHHQRPALAVALQRSLQEVLRGEAGSRHPGALLGRRTGARLQLHGAGQGAGSSHLQPAWGASGIDIGEVIRADQEGLRHAGHAPVDAGAAPEPAKAPSGDDAALINGVSQIAPFDAASKQALLEADDLNARCELLVQLMQFYGLGDPDEERVTLQ